MPRSSVPGGDDLHRYDVPAKRIGITVKRPARALVSTEALDAARLEEISATVDSHNNRPEIALDELLALHGRLALEALRRGAAAYAPPFDRFPEPVGWREATGADAEILEADGHAKLARDLRVALARGVRPSLGTNRPPDPEGSPQWYGWTILNAILRLRQLIASGSTIEAAKWALMLGRTVQEAALKGEWERDALRGESMLAGSRKGGAAAAAPRKAVHDQWLAYARELPAEDSLHSKARRTAQRFKANFDTVKGVLRKNLR